VTFREPCRACGGDGRTSVTETISVKVPAGVAQGNYIPLRGHGDSGPRGGPAGDLIVLIEEKSHDLFQRDGADLSVDLPVSFVTLAVGGRVEVPTLEQGEASLEVPAGTPSGKVMRLRGKGLPELRGGRGDLLVHLHVVVPTKLGAAERRLLDELGRLESFKAPRPSRSFFERMRDALAG
jgi:molecular chaperone DnaJ